MTESVFFRLPKGHPEASNPDLCYEANSAVYGLPQAARAWYLHFSGFLKSLGFHESSLVKGCFVSSCYGAVIFLILYVDDFPFASPSRAALDKFMKAVSQSFKAKFTFNVQKFVGLELSQKGEKLYISQTEMIERLAKQYRITGWKKVLTPMIENLKWNKDSKLLDNKKDQQVINGEVNYIAMWSRPDICFSGYKTSTM